MKADESDTVLAIKQKIATLEGAPEAAQELSYRGRTIGYCSSSFLGLSKPEHDERQLTYYDIPKDATIYLVLNPYVLASVTAEAEAAAAAAAIAAGFDPYSSDFSPLMGATGAPPASAESSSSIAYEPASSTEVQRQLTSELEDAAPAPADAAPGSGEDGQRKLSNSSSTAQVFLDIKGQERAGPRVPGSRVRRCEIM